MKTRDKAIALALSIVGASVIAWLSLSGSALAVVSLTARDTARAHLLEPQRLTMLDGDGVGHFEFAAEVPDVQATTVFLDVLPIQEGQPHTQGQGFAVDGTSVHGMVQLGSPEWPVRGPELYRFTLRDSSGHTFLKGDISVQVYPLAAPDANLAMFIGLLASVLQVMVLFWETLLVRRSAEAPAPARPFIQGGTMSRRTRTVMWLAIAIGATLFLTKPAAAETRVTELVGRLGASPFGSGYLDLRSPTSLKQGDELVLLVGGKAKRVVVRLLPQGALPDTPVGIIGNPMDVPASRIVRLTLSSTRDAVVQVSVHGGENPWGQIPLGTGNGPATLLRVERVSH
jgi:hypothetical protein